MRIRSLLSICIAFPFASCGTPEGDTVAEVTPSDCISVRIGTE